MPTTVNIWPFSRTSCPTISERPPKRPCHNRWLISATGGRPGNNGFNENPATFIPGNCVAGQFGLTAPGPCSSTANYNNRREWFLANPAEGRFYGRIYSSDEGGTQNYNGMLLALQRRFAAGASISANYTWSHCIGPFQDNEAANTGANPALPQIYPGARDRSRGNCSSDRRHVLNLTSVTEMPRFENTAMRYLASGWRLSAIYRYSTGRYLSITSGSNQDRARNGTNINSQPAQFLGGDPIGDDSGRPNTFWINPGAFALPDIGTLNLTPDLLTPLLGRLAGANPPVTAADRAGDAA